MSTLERAMTNPASMTPPSTPSVKKSPYKILEVKVISAHDLPPISNRLHTYVMAWAHPENKEITPVDHKGNTNPTWNHTMVFSVDDKFLSSNSSAVMMEIYNVSRLSNKPIGTTWLPIEILLKNPHSEIMKKPLTLQICRPSGDIKGFLVVSVNLINTTIRNRNEEDDNSRRNKMREIGHRLSHSASSKRMTFLEDYDDVNTLSDPERGSFDSDMKPLPSDVAVGLSNGGRYSASRGNAGVGTSVFDEWIESGGDYRFDQQDKKLSFFPAKNAVKRESKGRPRHRRHSDGGLLSYFTIAFMCGSSSTSNKNTNKMLKKNSKSMKKSNSRVFD
ncbi:C2 domain-containing protein [Heracleum sosnowskyi]|uniref:C2 domain-containing protein n=1 Tax=Heracleum sosnowskyi TaxID=360622 RepID=A0AAD8MCY1_9APIA|nr:C2 domain-containing protein [Heracleum sosnowskyi]